MIVAIEATPIININPRRKGIDSIPKSRSYRLYLGVPLDPKGWQKHYNKRTAVERVNSRLKEFAKLDNLKLRGLVKICLHSFLAIVAIQPKTITISGRLAEDSG